VDKTNDNPRVRHERATAWVEVELAAIIDTLQRAKLTARAGFVPRPAIRSAAVALAALDAAISDDLDLVYRMRSDAAAVAS
jgi:hypothetical protein